MEADFRGQQNDEIIPSLSNQYARIIMRDGYMDILENRFQKTTEYSLFDHNVNEVLRLIFGFIMGNYLQILQLMANLIKSGVNIDLRELY